MRLNLVRPRPSILIIAAMAALFAPLRGPRVLCAQGCYFLQSTYLEFRGACETSRVVPHEITYEDDDIGHTLNPGC